MMPSWDNDYLARLNREAERQINRELNFAWERLPIAITSGTATYTLPDYVRGITGISWKGRALSPLHQNEAAHIDHRYLTTRGQVDWYLRSPEDFQIIRFVRVPNETISADPDNDDLSLSTIIEERVVISYYREPDTSGDLLSLPDYIGRRLVKCYVLYRAFAKDGKTQDLRASSYYKVQYDRQLKYFKLYLGRMTMSKKKLTSLSDSIEIVDDMPRLDRGFNITPGPYKLHLGLTDNVLSELDDDLNKVLS